MNFQKKKWLVASLLAAAGVAQANVTTYTDAGAYDAALAAAGLSSKQVVGDLPAAAATNGVTDQSSYGVIDPGSITVAPATFTGLVNDNAAGFLAQNSYGISGVFYTHQLFHDYDNAFTITFASPVTAFSFESNAFDVFANPAGSGSSSLAFTLTTNAGEAVAGHTAFYSGSGDLGTAPVAFSGFVFDAPVSSVTITMQTQSFDVTRFAVVPSAVPEPEALVLTAAGMGVLGLVARRRKLVRVASDNT